MIIYMLGVADFLLWVIWKSSECTCMLNHISVYFFVVLCQYYSGMALTNICRTLYEHVLYYDKSASWTECIYYWEKSSVLNTFSARNFKELCNLGCYLQHAFERRREIILRSFSGWLVSVFVLFNTMPRNAFFFLYVTLYKCYEMYFFSNKVYICI